MVLQLKITPLVEQDMSDLDISPLHMGKQSGTNNAGDDWCPGGSRTRGLSPSWMLTFKILYFRPIKIRLHKKKSRIFCTELEVIELLESLEWNILL